MDETSRGPPRIRRKEALTAYALRMKIAIVDDYQDAVRGLDCFAKLAGHEVVVHHGAATEDELVAQLAGVAAVVLIRERTKITASLLARLPSLRVISQTGKAGPHIDRAACEAHGVTVLEGKGDPRAPAELTWALVMASSRFIVDEATHLRAGLWQKSPLGRKLHGRRLGVWSYGKIGALVAGYGKAFGMSVWAWGREGSLAAARADGIELAPSREAFFAESDVLSMHIRLVAETRGLVTADDLARMKPDALFVNTSRAELVGDEVLAEALRRGRPGFAAVDVYEREPVTRDNPLVALPNALCAPHLGYVEKDSYELYFGIAFDNLLALPMHPRHAV